VQGGIPPAGSSGSVMSRAPRRRPPQVASRSARSCGRSSSAAARAITSLSSPRRPASSTGRSCGPHLGVGRLSLPDAVTAKEVTGYEHGMITPFDAQGSCRVSVERQSSTSRSSRSAAAPTGSSSRSPPPTSSWSPEPRSSRSPDHAHGSCAPCMYLHRTKRARPARHVPAADGGRWSDAQRR
jgi:hypothetical protein